jgi:hypothetical protein
MTLASVWTWLTTPPTTNEVLDPFGVMYLIVFGVGFIACAYLSGDGGERVASNAGHAAGLRHWASLGLWVFGPGLVVFGVRALQINPLALGMPIWMAGFFVALVVFAARCVKWWRTDYPQEFLKGEERVPAHGSEISQRTVPAPYNARRPSAGQ